MQWFNIFSKTIEETTYSLHKNKNNNSPVMIKKKSLKSLQQVKHLPERGHVIMLIQNIEKLYSFRNLHMEICFRSEYYSLNMLFILYGH